MNRMNCRRVSEVMYLFFDNELEDEAQRKLHHHLATCPECARRIEYTRRLLLLVRQRCHRQCAPERLRVRILTSLRQPNELF